jgi:hypothetical protein
MPRLSTRAKLAALLQSTFPEVGGRPVVWHPDDLHPATGAYRSNAQLDCCRWEGWASRPNPAGLRIPMASVHSYETMTRLIKVGGLGISADGEIYAKCDTSQQR